MKIGTYYYPEQWPREQWERDFDTIATMGLQVVHMGEFAWFDLEPSPGEFRLDWLDECVGLAAKRKLGVILCTPTAAPPIWLVEKHPEVLPVDENGRRGRFGGRRHYNPTSPALHEAAKRVVTALAERFGDYPAVIGWQIDNEYCGPFDQSEQTHAAFGKWLKKRYGTVQELNKAWGCQFWNTYYTDFSQILMPASRDPKYGNPHQRLDASRFWSQAFAAFNRVQTDVLRPRIGGRFITTNFMSMHLDANPADFAGDFTMSTWDQYAVAGNEKDVKDETYRIADPAAVGLVHDQMASYHEGKWGVMELQPGQVNWSGVPVLLYPGAVRLWLWTAFAHGAEFVTTYRFRQPRFGIELFHHGLVGPDGVTASPGGRQFTQTTQEMKRLDLSKVPAVSEEREPGRTVGLVFDFEQLWYYETLPQARRWDQARWLRTWYGAITRLGLKVRILHPGKPWPLDLPMIVAPGLQMVDRKAVETFTDYAIGGGHLVLTCRTALMDCTGQLFEGPLAEPIVPLIGGMIEGYDGLPDGQLAQVEMDGKKYAWGVWGDLLYAEPDTRVLAKYADQFYAGAAAVIQRKHDRGLVTYCGVYGEAAFVEALVERLAGQTKLATTALPARSQLLRRGPYHVFLNYQDVGVAAPAGKNAKFLVGARRVEPAGVAVWEE